MTGTAQQCWELQPAGWEGALCLFLFINLVANPQTRVCSLGDAPELTV